MKRRYPLIVIFLLMLALLLPFSAAAFLSQPEIPAATKKLVSELDKQITKRYVTKDSPKSNLVMISTVPVFLGNLKTTNPLSRQISEEISSAMSEKGYKLNELRKADILTIIEKEGEFVLTRDVKELLNSSANGVGVVTGTYTKTSENIRYNISVIHLPTNEVMAKSSMTIPIRSELFELLVEDDVPKPPLMPSVRTTLN